MGLDRELPPRLYCGEKDTFAYDTARRRHPIILTNVIDYLSRLQAACTSAPQKDEYVGLTAAVAKLKYELWTDKPVARLDDHGPDLDAWNDLIGELQREYGADGATYFAIPWLYEECYLYRRMRGAQLDTQTLRDLDPFMGSKSEAWASSSQAVHQICARMHELNTALDGGEGVNVAFVLEELIQFSLWGNQSDLSLLARLTVDDARRMQAGDAAHLARTAHKVVVNDLPRVLDHLEKVRAMGPGPGPGPGPGAGKRIDIVLDNAGFELFNDLCLADWLVSAGYCTSVRLHVKQYPWFVSDAMEKDIAWTIEQLAESDTPAANGIAQRWQGHVSRGRWEVVAPAYWTLPYDYAAMAARDPRLYADLGGAALVVFKGDLNYRKLVGDRKWPVSAPFVGALQGFRPAPLVALRTNKAEVICGVPEDVARTTAAAHPDWLVTGEYAVIQAAL